MAAKRWPRLRRLLPLACALGAYAVLVVAGVSTFFAASPTLIQRGGHGVVVIWAVFCIVGGLFGVAGLVTGIVLIRLIGAALAATAGMVWFVAVALQATERSTAGIAACLALVMTLLFAQRWVDAYRASRR
jgi:hypothetical protein